MDPNGTPLQVINPVKETTMVYNETTSSKFDTVQAPHLFTYSLAAYLPTCKRALWFSADESSVPVQERNSSRDQARNDSLGLNLTEYEEAEYVELIHRSFTRANKETLTYICLTLGELLYTYIYDRLNIVC